MSDTRYRCTACGNLTRFDVTSTRRTRAYYHYSVGGSLDIEDEELLEADIESVVCRWCGPPAKVETISVLEASEETPDADAATNT